MEASPTTRRRAPELPAVSRLEELRSALADRRPRTQLGGLRRVLASVASRGLLSFANAARIEEIGFVSEDEELANGARLAMAELILCLGFEGIWPPEATPERATDESEVSGD